MLKKAKQLSGTANADAGFEWLTSFMYRLERRRDSLELVGVRGRSPFPILLRLPLHRCEIRRAGAQTQHGAHS